MIVHKQEDNASDSRVHEKELMSIYKVEDPPNFSEKATYSAQHHSSKLAFQEAKNAMQSCNPRPLYCAASQVSDAQTQGVGNMQYPCHCKDFPPPGPPCPTNDDLWNLQFCRWWGWNWIRKREEEMNRQKESPEIKTKMTTSVYKRSKCKTSERTKPRKKDDFFMWCNKLFKGGTKGKLKTEEKQQLKQLYATPCSSVTCPCAMNNLENQSVQFVGEYECSCSSTEYPCTPITVIQSKTRRQKCKYNKRKHQSWLYERIESSSSDESCQCLSTCPRKAPCSSAEESIKYLSLRMERMKSDCECCKCGKEPRVKDCSKIPCCSNWVDRRGCACKGCRCNTFPVDCRKVSPRGPCKHSSPQKIPRFRKCLTNCDYQPLCKCQCGKHVHPCRYKSPKCFPKPAKPKPCRCCSCQQRTEYTICCPCQHSKKICKKKLKCGCKSDTKVITLKLLDISDKEQNMENSKKTADKDKGTNCTLCCPCFDMNLCCEPSGNDIQNSNETQLCGPHLPCNKIPPNSFICNIMENNMSKALETGVYASPISGRMYNLNPKTFTTRAISNKSNLLPKPINTEDKMFGRTVPSFELPKQEKEHRLLLTAICEAILSSRTANKESILSEQSSSSHNASKSIEMGDNFNSGCRNQNHLSRNFEGAFTYEISNKTKTTKENEINMSPLHTYNDIFEPNIRPTEFIPTSNPFKIQNLIKCDQRQNLGDLGSLAKPEGFKNNGLSNIADQKMAFSNEVDGSRRRNSPENILNLKKNCENVIHSVDYTIAGLTAESVCYTYGGISTPKTVVSHSTPICSTSETYTKPACNSSNQHTQLTKPTALFVDKPFGLPINPSRLQNITDLLCTVSEDISDMPPSEETTDKYKSSSNTNPKFKKMNFHYNVLFSTIHPQFSNEFLYDSRTMSSPEYPPATVEEIPPSDIHEPTQTSECLLRQPVLICKDSSEKHLGSVNLHEKYSFLADNLAASASKDSESVVLNHRNIPFLKEDHSENELISINLNEEDSFPSLPTANISNTTEDVIEDKYNFQNTVSGQFPGEESRLENELRPLNLNRVGSIYSQPSSTGTATCATGNDLFAQNPSFNQHNKPSTFSYNRPEHELRPLNLNRDGSFHSHSSSTATATCATGNDLFDQNPSFNKHNRPSTFSYNRPKDQSLSRNNQNVFQSKPFNVLALHTTLTDNMQRPTLELNRRYLKEIKKNLLPTSEENELQCINLENTTQTDHSLRTPLVAQNTLRRDLQRVNKMIKYTHSENELQCLDLREGCIVHPYLQPGAVRNSNQSNVMSHGHDRSLQGSKSSLISRFRPKDQSLSRNNQNVFQSQPLNVLALHTTLTDNMQKPTLELNRRYLKELKKNLLPTSEENELQCINLENTTQADHSLGRPLAAQNTFRTDLQRVNESIKYTHSENELQCLDLREGYAVHPYLQPGPVRNNNQSNVMSHGHDCSLQGSTASLISRFRLLKNHVNEDARSVSLQTEQPLHCLASDIKLGHTEEVLRTINKDNSEHDLHFITNHLQSYSSISDTSSTKSSPKDTSNSYKYSETIPLTQEAQLSSPRLLVNSSTSPFNMPFQQPTLKSYVTSSTSPFKFKYIKMRANDIEPIDNERRKVMKQESPYSMFCVPVTSRNAPGPSNVNALYSRPERRVVVDTKNKLKMRQKRWFY